MKLKYPKRCTKQTVLWLLVLLQLCFLLVYWGVDRLKDNSWYGPLDVGSHTWSDLHVRGNLFRDLQSGVPTPVSLQPRYPNTTFYLFPGRAYYSSKLTTAQFVLVSFLDGPSGSDYFNKGRVQASQDDLARDSLFQDNFACCVHIESERLCTTAKFVYFDEFNVHICKFTAYWLDLRTKAFNVSLSNTQIPELQKTVEMLTISLDFAVPVFSAALSTLHSVQDDTVVKLKEWYSYHEAIGVDRFLIYFRKLQDLPKLEELFAHARRDVILIYFPSFNIAEVQRSFGYYDQILMMNHCLYYFAKVDVYTAYIDLDEFLTLSTELLHNFSNGLSLIKYLDGLEWNEHSVLRLADVPYFSTSSGAAKAASARSAIIIPDSQNDLNPGLDAKASELVCVQSRFRDNFPKIIRPRLVNTTQELLQMHNYLIHSKLIARNAYTQGVVIHWGCCQGELYADPREINLHHLRVNFETEPYNVPVLEQDVAAMLVYEMWLQLWRQNQATFPC